MSDIWFPFYVGDYLQDTRHLSQGEHGAYLCLLLYYYGRSKPIPHEKRYACACAHGDAERLHVDTVLGEFFVRSGDMWISARAEKILSERKILRETKQKAAKIKWDKERARADAGAVHMDTHHITSQSEEVKLQKKYDVFKFLNEEGLEAARVAADGWDKYRLMSIFNENINAGKMEAPKYPNKAFPAWCKTYTKGKPPQ